MRKSSSDSSKGSKSGARNSFNKDTGPKSYSKPSRPSAKKNYDGREPSAGSDRPGRPSKPYSGRVTGGDDKKPFGKPSFGKDQGERKNFSSDRKSEGNYDQPRGGQQSDRQFSDRPKRKFDSDKRPFDRPKFDRPVRSNESGEDRPRKTFDKPFRKDNDRPFSERPARKFDKPDFRKNEGDASSERPPRKEFDKPFRKDGDRPFKDRPARKDGDKPFRKEGDRPYKERPARAFDRTEPGTDGEKKFEKRKSSKPFAKSAKPSDSRPFRERPKSGFGKGPSDPKDQHAEEEKAPKRFSNVVKNVFNAQSDKSKAMEADDHPGKREQFEDKVYGELEEVVNDTPPKKPFEVKRKPGSKKFVHDHSEGRKKKYKPEEEDEDEDDGDKEISQKDGPKLEMPLNKFIAHSGECSRRDAAELVRQGKVKVNGELVLDPGYRVQNEDKVTMSGKKLTPQKGMVYILLNKPKGFITTNEDPQGRKTVMQLVGNSGVERLFPVGRLDRDTSGLLLITNDGDLTQKLCHPAYNVKKVYQVTLDKALTKADFEKIMEGVELEDGKAVVDAMSFLEKKNELGLEIHSGRNRIVRRIFESLGYVVDKLDRVMYAGLTKKNLPRSKWRYLDEREVVLLKHFKN